MRLSSSTSTDYVELWPVRYQFESTTGDEFDDNWLVIRGTVKSLELGEWSFEDPALLVSEAHEFSAWLRKAAIGEVAPEEVAEGVESFPQTEFIEPNIGIAVVDTTSALLTLRVFFSHESVPPSPAWPSDGWGSTVHFDLRIAPAALTEAVASWDAALQQFPKR